MTPQIVADAMHGNYEVKTCDEQHDFTAEIHKVEAQRPVQQLNSWATPALCSTTRAAGAAW